MSEYKVRTLPPLRVSESLRSDAESVLAPGETLSAFVLESVTRNIGFRRAQREFLARGFRNLAEAKKSGEYLSTEEVLKRLRARLHAPRRSRR